jgi:CheY-like chemotaxis protein
MDTKEKIKVLVVDDEKVVRDFLIRLLSYEGLEVKSADDGLKAVEAVQKEKFDLIFLDIKMPNMNGLETFSKLKKIDPDVSCVFMTGYALEAALLDKTKQPGVICLRKPFEDIKQIKEIANKVLQEARSTTKTQESHPDRRAYVRLDSVLEVDYRVKQGQGPFTPSLSKSQNIAPGGINFIVPEDIAPGAILELTIRIQGDDRACKAVGEVVWAKESQDKPGYYEIGIKFTKIDYAEFAAMIIR